MDIILVGYGKMGRAIERIAQRRGHSITGRFDNTDSLRQHEGKADAAIEFTEPGAAFENISTCIDRGIPVVSGTTGWLDRKPEIEALATQKDGAFFYASNFSLGVNLFFRLNAHLAKLMDAYERYAPKIDETHHTQKKDAPSGTAITLAEGLLQQSSRLNDWQLVEGDASAAEGQLPVRAYREPEVPGTHVVTYASELDRIEIKHVAHSREGFALGAVVAAEWLRGKTGSFGMEDLLNDQTA